MKINNQLTYVVYDGDCPACRNYVRFMRFRETAGDVVLCNARIESEWVGFLAQKNMSLDDGMVLVFQGQFYHGAEAVHRMALLGSRSGCFNRMNATIFRSPRLSRWLYPVLRAGRNALLFILGKQRISSPE